MAWIHAPDLPEENHGKLMMVWYEWWAQPEFEIVKEFSRDPHHCGGVWYHEFEFPELPLARSKQKKQERACEPEDI